jgi:hypothetical protein
MRKAISAHQWLHRQSLGSPLGYGYLMREAIKGNH